MIFNRTYVNWVIKRQVINIIVNTLLWRECLYRIVCWLFACLLIFDSLLYI
eukprot:UN01875